MLNIATWPKFLSDSYLENVSFTTRIRCLVSSLFWYESNDLYSVLQFWETYHCSDYVIILPLSMFCKFNNTFCTSRLNKRFSYLYCQDNLAHNELSKKMCFSVNNFTPHLSRQKLIVNSILTSQFYFYFFLFSLRWYTCAIARVFSQTPSPATPEITHHYMANKVYFHNKPVLQCIVL